MWNIWDQFQGDWSSIEALSRRNNKIENTATSYQRWRTRASHSDPFRISATVRIDIQTVDRASVQPPSDCKSYYCSLLNDLAYKCERVRFKLPLHNSSLNVIIDSGLFKIISIEGKCSLFPPLSLTLFNGFSDLFVGCGGSEKSLLKNGISTS